MIHLDNGDNNCEIDMVHIGPNNNFGNQETGIRVLVGAMASFFSSTNIIDS